NREITLARRIPAQVIRLIRVANVRRSAIAIRVNRDRCQPQIPTSAHDPDSDLAAIGDQHLHSGMFPCLRGGFLSRLVSNWFRAVISFRRVSRGAMTSSMKPRLAAT